MKNSIQLLGAIALTVGVAGATVGTSDPEANYVTAGFTKRCDSILTKPNNIGSHTVAIQSENGIYQIYPNVTNSWIANNQIGFTQQGNNTIISKCSRDEGSSILEDIN